MTDQRPPRPYHVAIIGGGPAGLMAAERLSQAGMRVDLYDGMASVGRKFLLAGVGGMNITHSEALPAFISRYAERSDWVAGWLRAFDADHLRTWIQGLGIDTFVGSSGRVFPTDMKAAPLLRAWLKRLRDAGVVIHTRHRWLGWQADGVLKICYPQGEMQVRPDATVLALGGASWTRLGSDGAWVPGLEAHEVEVNPLQAANCGFEVGAWSDLLRERFAGAPLKNIAMGLSDGPLRLGECVVTATGVEGSLVYALSAQIRERINAQGKAVVHLDLLPSTSVDSVVKALSKPRGSRSMAKHLHSQLGLDGVKAGLLRELAHKEDFADTAALARLIKQLPVTLVRPRPLDEAISTAGGVAPEALDERLMLKNMPGVFCAGEMLDWEAPTGGYLLTACFASGCVAADGVLSWLTTFSPSTPTP
ncbi:TIGR03862 family flavoprotein [Pseudomonas sp. dw_358]|uniref:TIGR03862 family flavoprotein n=1 Tax=Pseudomonas sp. dw_358 TaxID=2720083 RepID=UPI001BD3E420|nr:TIGR03862 family flavoprotein [Pseudomonas sp. dw_358]